MRSFQTIRAQTIRAYTLIELLVVVVIIGITTTVVLTTFAPKFQEKTQTQSDIQILTDWIEVGKRHAQSTGQVIGVHYEEEKGFWLSIYQPDTYKENQNADPKDWRKTGTGLQIESTPILIGEIPWRNPQQTLQSFQEGLRFPFLILYPNGSQAPIGEIRLRNDNDERIIYHGRYTLKPNKEPTR